MVTKRGGIPPLFSREQARAAVAAHGTIRAAARALGVNHGTLSRAINGRNYGPPRGPRKHIPDGHELAGLSTLTGPNGEPRGAWHKTRVAGTETPEFTPVPAGHHIVSTATNVRGDGTVTQQWIRASQADVEREAAVLAAWERHAAVYAGLAAPIAPPAFADDALLAVYPIGDPHIGMLAWAPETGDHHDATIACRELLGCVRELVRDAPPAREALIINLGDALHAQDNLARTPGHGHQLDVDGRYGKILDALHVLVRGIVDAALEKHEHVTMHNLDGNHDPRVAVELMYWLRAVYEREPRVTIAPAHRAHQYYRFGKTLIGMHHGDRTKKGELPAIMAADHDGGGTGWWGETTEHVWHVGHEHHTTQLETPSCLTWVHNTLAAADAHHAGRYRSKRMLKVITYHREFGEHATATVSLARVRAALSCNM